MLVIAPGHSERRSVESRGVLCTLAVLVYLATASSTRGQDGPLDYLERIDDEAAFVSVSVQVGAERRLTKYLVPAREDPSLLGTLFQNVNRFEFHRQFLAEVFPDRFPGLTVEEYLRLVERRADRQYFAGSLVRFDVNGTTVHGFSIFTDSRAEELPRLEEVRRIYELLAPRYAIGELAYAPQRQAARAAARNWIDPGFPIYVPEGGGARYEAYTRGVGYGRVRLMDADAFDAANARGLITWQDILILEHAPGDIEGVVGGVITAELQGDLSHLAIRTARRGTPNAFLANAAAVFGAFDGQLVRLEVRQSDFTVEPATADAAQAWWDEARPTLSRAPSVDAEYASLDALSEMQLTGIEPASRYGGKGTNMARLQGLFADESLAAYREVGFVIPLRFYQEFMRSNHRRLGRETLSYEEYLLQTLALDSIETDAAARFEALEEFRTFATVAGQVSPELVNAITEKIEEVFGAANVPLRFRSSSNVEDVLEFNGAGLYDSTTGCAADSQDDDTDGPSHCDAEQANERTIERALKRVWTSLWTFRAHEERSWYQIDPATVGMGILVTRAFLDEAANGVAFTGNPANAADRRFLITAQVGETSVVRPPPGVRAERDILHVDDDGAVLRIERSQRSSLVAAGEHVLSGEQLGELGAVLRHIDRNLPVELGDHEREDVLFDVEFKVESGGDLAIKQVRPFLLTQEPPPSPTFFLQVPEGTLLCGVFGEGRTPLAELRVKSQLRLRAGTHELPTAVGSFPANLIEDIAFGEHDVQAVGQDDGFVVVEARADGQGDVTYEFTYTEPFTLPGGERFDVRLSFLSFRAQAGGNGGADEERTRVLDDAFITDDLVLEGVPDGDRRRLVRYASCGYESLPLWRIDAQLEGGATLALESRFRQELSGTGPAALVAAEVELVPPAQETRDYWNLVYAAQHHNFHARYLVRLDPPIAVPGVGRVHAVELAEPKPDQNAPAEALYRDADLNVLQRLRVLSFRRCEPEDCATRFRRGDADVSGQVDITDAVVIVNSLFVGGRLDTCPDAADIDDNGNVDTADAILLLTDLFRDVRLIREPGPETCGLDPTPDTMLECTDPLCGGV